MAETLEEQRHNLTHAIGECILAWAKVENAVTLLFVHCLDENADYIRVASVFEAVISLDARLSMIGAALKDRGAIEPWITYTARWAKMEERIRRMYTKRNGVAHSDIIEYNIEGKPEECRVLTFPTTTRNVIEPGATLRMQELVERQKWFKELTEEIIIFRHEIEPSLGRPQE